MGDFVDTQGAAAAAAAGLPVPDPPGVAWSEQEEYLLALWADRALCYKLMHENAQQIYKRHHMWFSIPTIILSTITGTANVAIASYVPAAYQDIAQLIIGAINLFGGVLSTLQNYFRAAEKCEAHRHASVSWGKLYRAIFVELSVARAKRRPVVDFLRV
ncbi:MAG: SLATT domain-containing protein, partial [Proteobacteria bacterium]|nr:SLATT domain-containing protein [Pseudomonadota bacterium]